jgi:uncharacterized caspase-like protein
MDNVRHPTDYAIVIGINRYWGTGVRELSAAEADAERFAAWLADAEGGGLHPDHILLRSSQGVEKPANTLLARPHQHEIDAALAEIGVSLRSYIGRRLYFYFAGHGLAPEDADVEDVAMLMANADTNSLYANIGLGAYLNYLHKTAPFEQLVFILDCCREFTSGAMPSRPIFTDHFNAGEARSVERLVILGAGYGSKAYEPDQRRGLLTTALLEALDQAGNFNGVVLASELRRYIEQRVPELAQQEHREQKAQVKDLDRNMNLGIARKMPRVKVRIQPPAGNTGTFMLRGAQFEILDQYDHVGTWEIFLKPGLYEVEHVPSGKTQTFSVKVGVEVLNVVFV